MGNISERRKLRTAAEFRVKATSLRTVAAELKQGQSRDNILAMAAAWDAKAEAAEADEALRSRAAFFGSAPRAYRPDAEPAMRSRR
jgi:hypothetical protein